MDKHTHPADTLPAKQEATPTPGPWGVCEGVERGSVVIASAHVDDAIVASVGQDLPECGANARLIAAAPLLLEACKAAVALYSTANICHCAFMPPAHTGKCPSCLINEAIRAATEDTNAK